MIPAIAQIAGGLRQTAGQAAQTALGYAGVNFNYAQLDQREREMAAQYGLDKILKTAEAQHYLTGGKAGGLTGPQWVEAMGKMTNILNDINKPSSDKAGNLARIRIFNSMNEALGSPLPPIPLQGEGAPGKVSALTQLYRGVVGGPKVSDYTTQPGAGSLGMPWPSITPLQGAQP
jgi:hypothetical protein